MNKMLSLAVLLSLALSAVAEENGQKVLLNLDKSGLALRGYDPVAYFTVGKPVKGSPEFVSEYRGGRYQFASPEHKQLFDDHPAKYEPAYGGYCGYGVAHDALAPIDPAAFTILNGRLILQKSKSVLADWKSDVPGNYARAERNWPGLVHKKGK